MMNSRISLDEELEEPLREKETELANKPLEFLAQPTRYFVELGFKAASFRAVGINTIADCFSKEEDVVLSCGSLGMGFM